MARAMNAATWGDHGSCIQELTAPVFICPKHSTRMGNAAQEATALSNKLFAGEEESFFSSGIATN